MNVKIQKKLKLAGNTEYESLLKKMRSEISKLKKEGIKSIIFNYDNNLKNNIEKDYLKNKNSLLSYHQLFIPAGRSFFANLQSSIFSFISNNNSIDPFLRYFGMHYEGNKKLLTNGWDNIIHKEKYDKIEKLINKITCGEYKNINGKDYIINNDGRKIALENSSSAQQETFPLTIVLKKLLNSSYNLGIGQTVYIEEPEAHLFPVAQKQVIEFISSVFNINGNTQFIITTHSPYILTSFNNLLQAGELIEKHPEKAEDVYKIVDKHKVLFPHDLAAYAFDKEKAVSICNEETGLIDAEMIDSVSDNLAEEFDSLLELED